MEAEADSGRPLRFLLVGAWNGLFGFLAFIGAYWLTAAIGCHYIIALVLAHVLAVTNAFVCHRRFVFGMATAVVPAYFRFSAIYLWSLAFNIILLPIGVTYLQLHPIITQGLLLGITAAISYIVHGRFTFRAERRA